MAEGKFMDRFYYVYSCDLEANVQIKIGTLEGKLERPNHREFINDPLLKFCGIYKQDCADLYVTCQVYDEGTPMALPVRTAYKAFTTRWNWSEWLTLPVRYSDLPRNAQLALTIWDIYGADGAIPIGGTTIALFGKYGMFRSGMIDLRVWPKVSADGNIPTSTPGKTSSKSNSTSSKGPSQMTLLSKLSKRHHNGHIVKVDWLDRLTFREIGLMNESEKRDSNFMYLMVEFPQVKYDQLSFTVIYYERDGDEVFHSRSPPEMVFVPDPEITKENIVEMKHHKLVRSLRSGPADRDLKPNAVTRDQLNNIVHYPPIKALTSEEEDLVWKFRFYLSNQKKALTKFLKAVNWSVKQETKQALDLLRKWSPMDVEDALELLSPSFAHPAVRKYAVTRLKSAPDEDLLLYLLQLVQALRYENFDEIKAGLDTSVQREKEDNTPVMESTVKEQESDPDSQSSLDAGLESQDDADEIMQSVMAQSMLMNLTEEMDLATFLIYRACKNTALANYFYWYLLVETDDPDNKDKRETHIYLNVMRRFSQALMKSGKDSRLLRSQIVSQQTFMEQLVNLVKVVARESGNRKKKIERLQALLTAQPDDANRYNFSSFDPLILPLDPDVKIRSIIASKATLFKSALMPCRLTFKTVQGTEYTAIFKHGDDLRQDQLILQIITLMDRLLRRENLDLKLTPYKVLATSSKHGFVQFVDSQTIAEVLATEGSILNYFRKHAPSESGPYGIAKDVMDSYIKSCAGYCVVTYVLGVGDRHLDNLLLTKTGKLFHIDFGYILGRDPKPLPPPMKLSKEMVEAMGGDSSEHFQEFKKLSYTAFLHLRRHSNLFLNLFSLMVDASVPDIALEPDKTVKKVQDKFRLDLTDEEAVQYMQNLIDISVSAMMAALVEQMHKIAQYWRK